MGFGFLISRANWLFVDASEVWTTAAERQKSGYETRPHHHEIPEEDDRNRRTNEQKDLAITVRTFR